MVNSVQIVKADMPRMDGKARDGSAFDAPVTIDGALVDADADASPF
jgi:hypothetical protein